MKNLSKNKINRVRVPLINKPKAVVFEFPPPSKSRVTEWAKMDGPNIYSERGSPLYKLFGAGWGQKVTMGHF